MTLSKNAYKGTRDFYPEDQRVQNYIFNKLKTIALQFGYEEYNGPMIEEVELYKAKSGVELINDQIYSFHDRGKRFVAIRPEMTPTLARMVAKKQKELPKPIRWFSIPNLMRYERPQRGRLREHFQFNADLFGLNSKFSIIEIISLLIMTLESFGANESQFNILINNRKIIDALFSQIFKLSNEDSYKLYKLIDKSKKITKEDFQSILKQTISLDKDQTKVFNEYLELQNFEQVFSFIKNYKLDLGTYLEELKFFNNIISEQEIFKYIKFDPSIVRGLDYYTGFVFEVFDLNPQNPRAICGGGQYEDLLKIFNAPALSGVGFGLGDVTLVDFLKTHKLLPDLSKKSCQLLLSIQSSEAEKSGFLIANQLRQLGLQVIYHPEKLKINKAFIQGERNNAKCIAFIGTDEIKDQSISIKNIKIQKKQKFKMDNFELIKNFILE